MKMSDRAGETLLETLLALLIILLCMGFLATALTTAARMNRTLSQRDQGFAYDEAEVLYENQTILVDGKEVTVTIYESNGYYYYEYSE